MAPRPYRGGPVPAPPVLPARPGAILVVRLSARGDVMFATPIIRSLRKRWPDAHLAWVVEPASKDVVEHHPELDEVIVWDRPRWKRLLKERRFRELRDEYRAFRDRLRSRKFDIALDMQGLARSGLVALLSGARIRIGLGSKEGSSLIMHHRYPTGRVVGPMSADVRLLAEWLGMERPGGLDVTLAPPVREGARGKLAQAGVDGPFILIVPFTTRPWKHWFEPRWAALARELHAASGLPVVMTGGPADRPAADRLLAEAGNVLTDLVGRTTLGEAMGVVAEASLVLGVDTGLTHAAHAFRRPTVCVFGPSGYSEPPTPMARMVRYDLACAPCTPRGGRPTCGGAWTCMDLISGREVMEHARDLLAAYPPERGATW